VKPGQAGAALNHRAAAEGFLAEASDNPIVIPLVIVICDGVCVRAPQGAARVSESNSRVPPDLVLLVVENNIAERQENF